MLMYLSGPCWWIAGILSEPVSSQTIHSGETLRRLLLEKRREKRRNTQEVLAALSFLEVEERTGRASLDVTEFRYIVTRLCELARLDSNEVCQEPHSILPLSCAQ